MDNVGGRASWNNIPYNHTNLRQPNIIGATNSTDNKISTPSTSSRLSIDAPEFVPRFKAGPTHPAIVSPVMPLIDPAIIHQGHSYHPGMSGNQDHVNHISHPHQQQQHHQHIHSQQMHNNVQQQTMGGKPDHRYSVQNRLSMGRGGGGGGGGSSMNHGGDYNNSGDMYGQQAIPSQQNEVAQTFVTEKETRVLTFLSDVMNKLTDNPGMFEEIQRQMTNMFFDFSSNSFVMSNAVEMIFELSVDEQNFRYIGARLCRLLDSIDPRPNSIFRNLLALKMDDHQAKLQQFIFSAEKRKVRGTALFLAELYMQMQNDGNRVMIIAESIINAMTMLLENLGPENVKCVCQALKLCGYELELDCASNIQNIIQTLQKLEGHLDTSTGRLLKSVLDLKANGWERREPIVMAPIMETIRQDYNDAPVFYGPDGKVLTDEENSFLLSNIPSYPTVNYEDFEDSNDPDELVEAEPEMDLEIQMAFKDFVKGAKNKQT